MDISKCVPSIKMSGLSLTDPPEEQTTLVSGSLSPKGAHWVGPFFLIFFLFRPKCKIFFFLISFVLLFF